MINERLLEEAWLDATKLTEADAEPNNFHARTGALDNFALHSAESGASRDYRPLKAHIYAYEANRDERVAANVKHGLFESTFDFFEAEDSAVDTLKQFCGAAVMEVARHFNASRRSEKQIYITLAFRPQAVEFRFPPYFRCAGTAPSRSRADPKRKSRFGFCKPL